MNFQDELRALINRFSQENGSNTPDYILATYLIACLAAFDAAVEQREGWYGRGPSTTNLIQPPTDPMGHRHIG